MSGNPFDPLTFFEALQEFDKSGDTTTADKEFRLATVDPAYTGTGDPKLQFDGEAGLTLKTYKFINETPAAGARVVLAPVGFSYVILGALGSGTPAVIPPKGLVARHRRTTAVGDHNAASASGARKIIELPVPVTTGRTYEILASCSGYVTGGGGMGLFQNDIRGTTDGSAPSTTSPLIRQHDFIVYAGPGYPSEGECIFHYDATFTGTLRLLLSQWAATAGSGPTSWGAAVTATLPALLVVKDMGVSIPAAGGTQF